MRLLVYPYMGTCEKFFFFLNNMGDNASQKTSKYTQTHTGLFHCLLVSPSQRTAQTRKKLKSYITIFYFPTNLSTEPFFFHFLFLVFSFVLVASISCVIFLQLQTRINTKVWPLTPNFCCFLLF